MNTTLQFLIILLSSGVIAAIVSGVITAVMQKRNEKEQRIFKELKAFLAYVSEVYKKCSLPDYNEKNSDSMFDKLWEDADKIEDLMRKDLGFE